MESYDIKDDIIDDSFLYKSSIISGLDLDLESNPDEELKLIPVVFPR
jgi:hypothetical protein